MEAAMELAMARLNAEEEDRPRVELCVREALCRALCYMGREELPGGLEPCVAAMAVSLYQRGSGGRLTSLSEGDTALRFEADSLSDFSVDCRVELRRHRRMSW